MGITFNKASREDSETSSLGDIIQFTREARVTNLMLKEHTVHLNNYTQKLWSDWVATKNQINGKSSGL